MYLFKPGDILRNDYSMFGYDAGPKFLLVISVWHRPKKMRGMVSRYKTFILTTPKEARPRWFHFDADSTLARHLILLKENK
jgi:hypothetical protein